MALSLQVIEKGYAVMGGGLASIPADRFQQNADGTISSSDHGTTQIFIALQSQIQAAAKTLKLTFFPMPAIGILNPTDAMLAIRVARALTNSLADVDMTFLAGHDPANPDNKAVVAFLASAADTLNGKFAAIREGTSPANPSVMSTGKKVAIGAVIAAGAVGAFFGIRAIARSI